MKNYTQKFIGILTLVFSMSFTVNSQEIGDVYEGGYIFQINEDGTGLVADLQDLGLMNWYDAINIAETISSGGYEDWLLPSLEQLELMYETIGIGGPENIGGFETYTWPYYWSSTEQSANYAWLVSFGASNPGGTGSDNKNDMGVVRVIRLVTFITDILGCTDTSANNYNEEATVEDESCTYAPEILLIPEPIEFTNGEISSLFSSQDLWDFGAIYDADNSLEELTITLSVNPDEINLVWDGGINSNPTVSAVSDFSGSTEIELCISDAISSVCGSNIIIVYEDSSTEDDTADNYLDLPEGWSMFGYTCLDSLDAMEGFSSISDKIEIVKDEWGLSYLPSWEFNAMGSLHFSEGYQIKMLEEVTDFQFCEAIVQEDGISQDDVDAAYADGAASYTPLYQVGDMVEGGIVFYVDETGQHGLVAAQEDLEGTYEWGCYQQSVSGADSQWIGSGLQNTMDITNQGCATENGSFTGNVTENSGTTAAQAALDAEINGFSDWYLPSIGELQTMYITIGQGSENGNIGGFENSGYWSSSEYTEFEDDYAWTVVFYEGAGYYYKYFAIRVRVIRAF